MSSNLQIVSEHYAASARKDLPAMLACLADDVQWVEAAGSAYAGTWVGVPQLIENVFKRIGADWDGFEHKLERLVDGGDTIVALGEYSGTYRKTGKAMRVRVVHVWQLAGGKVRRFEQFADTALMAQAMA